jgi:dihydropteroate synthase
MIWKTSRREISVDRTLVMAILNVTPDSFSDGGRFADQDAALARAGEIVSAGADIIDIGGESTRPNSRRVAPDEEIRRVVPIIEAIVKRFEVPVSIDTSKDEVARAALGAGAEIVNDVSGLRFDERIAGTTARTGAGLVLMHLRGTFETMHEMPPVEDVFADVSEGLRLSIETARRHGVEPDRIALDVGIGFSKSFEQNLQLISCLDRITGEFSDFPVLVGVSRKSFLGRILNGRGPTERIPGSISAGVIAIAGGARILRAHDVRATVDAARVADQILGMR